jgi:hypothetical protein
MIPTRLRNRHACLVLALFTVAPAAAQAGYRFPEGDTLRYRERTESRLEVNGGATVVPVTHEAVVAMHASGEGVRAWYDSLSLTVRLRGPVRRLPTVGAIGLPFQLHVSSQGRVELLEAPVFPAELTAFSDLTRQFQDFLVTLPAEPLGENSQWTEMVELDGLRATRTFRVTGDSVIGGEQGLVIAVTQQIRMESARGEAMSVLEGQEQGTAVFSASSGRMLARRSEGRLRGTMTVMSGARRVEVPQSFGYTHTIRLID